ncbi:UNVERIFIED_ORG: hypothetical protein EC838_0086 [Providencia alcalifaciens]
MSNFDRDLQFKIIELAVNDYPSAIFSEHISDEINNLKKSDIRKLIKNIAYLQEENLITGGLEPVSGGYMVFLNHIKATKNAINLLSEEGSISASLKIVTVKLHDDTLAVLRDFINQNVTDPEEKKGYLQRLKELPADATKHIVLEILGKGLNQLPNAVQWLQTVLHP